MLNCERYFVALILSTISDGIARLSNLHCRMQHSSLPLV